MADIQFKYKNDVYLTVECDPSIAQELNDHFSFEAPGARFHPLFRSKMWDGKIKLFSMFTKEIYVGLKSYVEHFAEVNQYTVDYEEWHEQCDAVNEDIVREFCQSLNLGVRGEPLDIREYQIDAIYQAISSGRKLLLSPTGSGKSLILYCLMRWNLRFGRKQLILVPTTSLVEQLYADFKDYSCLNGWKVSENIHRIYAGHDKETDLPIVISTWQSIYEQPKKFFEKFQCVYGDECLHHDTEISMSDGTTKKIKNITIGDMVVTFNEETKRIENKPVLEIHHNLSINEQLFEVYLENGTSIKITGNHKVLLITGEWRRADELEVGDLINSIE